MDNGYQVQDNHLVIGGVDAADLAAKYGTPLDVYDVSMIKGQIRAFKKVFEESNVDYAVSYASKAFACLAMYQLVNREDAHIDVVSGGELYTAIRSGFPMEDVSFHGNNKSREELEMAVSNNVGMIMLDNFYEIKLLNQILEEKDATANVMLRVSPAVSAHTHEFIQTGQQDSKFGFDILTGQADQALEKVLQLSRMKMKGVHSHIGSQIFETNGFEIEVKKLVDLMKHWQDEYDYTSEIINVGGGFGIKYTKDDQPIPPEAFVQKIVDTVKQQTKKADLREPAIWIEPGRSIAGPAGCTLYTVGSEKDIPGIRKYVAVDGGMGDNIRPALYGADYEAVVANNVQSDEEETVSIAGKYCESGDIIIKDTKLPKTKAGDLIAVLATGAYGYAMASNYNLNPKPAVVFVENGKSQVVIEQRNLC